jgi:UDP-GlcNAc:undecaprenyl-phosphate GlcNAc-1-phosphate transferase
MLLGFLLAAIGISLTQGPVSDAPPWVPILAVGLPLADTIWAVLRRLAAGAPVFAPDKRHIHHLLLERGLSQRAAVAVLWTVSAAFCGLAVLLAVAD